MKIKYGFITNSSSTVYIVFIPDSYKITSNEISNLIQSEIYNNNIDIGSSINELTLTKENEIKTTKYILEDVENLKKGEGICYYPHQINEMLAWKVLLRICEENDFFMTSIELPSEGNSGLIGITEKVLISTLKAHLDIDEFMKPFILEKNRSEI